MINSQPLEPELTFVKIIEVSNGEDYIDYFYGLFKTKEDFQNSVMRKLSLTDTDHIEFYYKTIEGIEKKFNIWKISSYGERLYLEVYHSSSCQFTFECNSSEFVETFEKQLKINLELN